MLSRTLFLTILPLAFAKTIHVNVGENGLTFDPASITADMGDEIQFEFYPGSHSVAQSTFDKPCQPSSGGFFPVSSLPLLDLM